MNAPACRQDVLTASTSAMRRAALTLALLSAAAIPALASQPFDVTSFKSGTMHQAGITERASPEAGCAAQYDLSDRAGEGEHTIYQRADLSGEAVLRLRVRAAQRYGVEVGFASGDWASFSQASISLISGAFAVTEGGSLKPVRTSVEARPDGWVEISLNVVDRKGRGGSGHAFIKLTAEGGLKSYRGRPGLGVELCAISR